MPPRFAGVGFWMAKADDSHQAIKLFLLAVHLLSLLSELFSILLDLLLLSGGLSLTLLNPRLLFCDLFLLLFEGIYEQHAELIVFNAFDLAPRIGERQQWFHL